MHGKTGVAVGLDDVCSVIDLKDFPHGELINTRKDDKYDIEFYSVPDGTRVPSYNPSTGSIEWMPVKCWSVHRGKKLEIVTLSDGSQLYTDDDPRAIYGIAVAAKDLDPTRFTPSAAQAAGVLIPITTDAQAGGISRSWYDFETGLVSDVRGDKSVSVGFSFGQFVGIMAGDGWADSSGKIYIADNEGFNIDFVTQFLRTVYPNIYTSAYEQTVKTDASRYGDTVRYRINVGTSSLNARVKELVDGHRDCNTSGSANKRLPMWYQFAGREFISGLVCGMMATDGSVAVSHGKAKPQLQLQYTSTSLRLAREFQRCCRLLGCRCSVSFSKHTSGGNTSWLCTISTVDAKRVGLLTKCCNVRKRDTFLDTEVPGGACNIHNDYIPFPTGLSTELVACIPSVKVPVTDDEVKLHNLCLNVRARAKKGRLTRHWIHEAVRMGNKMAKDNESAKTKAVSVLSATRVALDAAHASGKFRSQRDVYVSVSMEIADIFRDGVKACQTLRGDKKIAGRQLSSLSRVREKGRITMWQANELMEFFSNTPAQTCLRDSHALKQLVKLADSTVRWESIVKVEKTDVEEVGYDLTVPGYDTFVNADGVVLSNTMNFHVPSTDKAVEEAKNKMLPSKNLFSTTDLRSPRFVPMMETTLGLARLTAPQSNKKPQVFITAQDAIRAYRRGEIGANDPVSILKP